MKAHEALNISEQSINDMKKKTLVSVYARIKLVASEGRTNTSILTPVNEQAAEKVIETLINDGYEVSRNKDAPGDTPGELYDNINISWRNATI